MPGTLSKNNYLIQLDGLRAIAVLAVMLSHFLTYKFIVLIPLGSIGVNIFFVLSGFLITRILLNSREKVELKMEGTGRAIKQFYIRRILRIFPVYYLTITVLVVINFSYAKEVCGWLYSYLMNFKFAMPGIWESNYFHNFNHFWSLCVEEQFYLIFPFLIFYVPVKRIKPTLIIIILLGIISRILLFAFDAPRNSLYVLTPCCLDAFGTGALMSYYYLYESKKLEQLVKNNYLFALMSLLYIADIIYSRKFIKDYGECRTVLERALFSACCFFIIGKAIYRRYSGLFKRFLEHKWTLYIGKISYGLYIFHNFAFEFFNSFIKKYPIALLLWISHSGPSRALFLLLTSILVASISWYFIEYPINKLKKKFEY
jgi:peptidoglycan/LPS O-acetylase OafA/YrhL